MQRHLDLMIFQLCKSVCLVGGLINEKGAQFAQLEDLSTVGVIAPYITPDRFLPILTMKQ